MKFKTIYGKEKRLPYANRYLINWASNSRSIFQTDVKTFLHYYWKNDVVYEEMPIVSSRLTIDLYNHTKKVAVEVQGHQHIKYVKFFHGNRKNFLEQLKRDKMKEDFAKINGIKLVLIYPEDDLSPTLFEDFGVSL